MAHTGHKQCSIDTLQGFHGLLPEAQQEWIDKNVPPHFWY